MLSSPGLGSGLDVNGIVGQLMSLEQRPLMLLSTRETKQQAQLSAFGSLKGALSAFQTGVNALAKPSLFTGLTATLADTSLATVSAASNAAAGSHEIQVTSLAQAHKIKSEAFASTSTAVGSGSLTIEFGRYDDDGLGNVTFSNHPEKAATTITIDPAKSTLAEIRAAINEADAGVTASIINDGGGNRLVIASKDTGLDHALKITVNDSDSAHTDNDGLSQLAFDATTGGTTNMTETVSAKNAAMVIDGIDISKSSNTISDALEGVTFNLTKADLSVTTSLTVSRDTASVQKAVGDFVKAYNDLETTINNLSRFNAESRQGSILTGDSTVRAVQNRMRSMLTTAQTDTANGISTLSQIGVSFQKDGMLALDNNKLTAVLNDPTKDIASFFANQTAGSETSTTVSETVQASDSLISILNQPAAFEPGSFAVNITQLATQGSATASKVAGLSINSVPLFANNTLDVTIDGVSASITLADGSYTADSLAAEIQSKINSNAAFSSAGISTTVSQNAGVLSVTSNSYGTSSSVLITDGSGKDDLFGTPTQTAGQDVAGTIGGLAATGSGKTLSASGALSGLVLNVNGGSTGARGTVDLTQTTETIGSDPNSIGLAGRLNTFIDGLLRSDGLINGRMDGINASIKDIGKQQEALARRLEGVERRIRAQFTALDTLIASMGQTSSFLQQQLASLPGARQ